jgi:histidyl-tRNA synthetase
VGKVWRGERPQKGRYREFYQCDFDVVGTVSPSADLEVALVMNDALDALGAGRFQIRLNDRAILNGLLASLDLLPRSECVLREVDKLDKVGADGVKEELVKAQGLTGEQADAVLSFTRLSAEKEGDDLLRALEERFASNELAKKGVDRLRFVVASAQKLRPRERFRIDLSIARGLGYYTGTVYETVLLDAPEFGSVCSGGRYDDLASYYTKNTLPGVGASVGLSRLLAAQEKLAPAAATKAPCPVIIITAPEVDPFESARIASLLRDTRIGAEVYPDQAKMGKQFKYGDARGFALAVIVAPDELSRNAVKLKDMRTQEQVEVTVAGLVEAVRSRLA